MMAAAPTILLVMLVIAIFGLAYRVGAIDCTLPECHNNDDQCVPCQDTYCRKSQPDACMDWKYRNMSTATSSTNARVFTDPEVSLRARTRAEIRCTYNRKVYAVYWNKMASDKSVTNILYLDMYNEAGKVFGPGYEDGNFSVYENFSLIINEVKFTDKGQYICEVADSETGTLISNQTTVSVIALPVEPFPAFSECTQSELHLSSRPQCEVQVLDCSTTNITCTVSGYYPSIMISFFHGGYEILPVNTEKNNPDGTMNKSISISVTPSPESYMCAVLDLPDGTAGRTLEIYVVCSTPPSPNTPVATAGGSAQRPSYLTVAILLSLLQWHIFRRGVSIGN